MSKSRRKPASRGLGDTIEKITEATGIKAFVKFIAGEDCGCDERKAKLNLLFPYSKPECLNEDEHTILTLFFEKNTNIISPILQNDLLKIYNRIFHQKETPTNCASCFKNIVQRLKIIYDEYDK